MKGKTERERLLKEKEDIEKRIAVEEHRFETHRQRTKALARKPRNRRLVIWGSQIEYHLKLSGIPEDDISKLSTDAIKRIVDNLFHDTETATYLNDAIRTEIA